MRVNGIGPGLIQTVLREYYRKAADRTEKLIRQQPYNTWEPAEIAEVALLLAGDRASYLTGQTIVVDGGATLTSMSLTLHLRTVETSVPWSNAYFLPKRKMGRGSKPRPEN